MPAVTSLKKSLRILILAMLVSTWPLAQEPAPEQAQEPAPELIGDAPLTVARVSDLLGRGIPSARLVGMIETHGGEFDLTVEDVVRLSKSGASIELIRLMARGTEPAPGTGPRTREEEIAGIIEAALSQPPPPPPSPDALTFKQALRLHRRGMPSDQLAAQVAEKGLTETPELDQLLEAAGKGLPPNVIRAMAGGGADPAVAKAPSVETAPIQDPKASKVKEADPKEEEPEEKPAERRVELQRPPPESQDRVWISSIPTGARVLVSPARARSEEWLDHDYLVGRTPLSVDLGPGDYNVVVQKEAGEFEKGLLPAWRTFHDTTTTRSILDNADLTFDPASCCLPGSLSGTVDVHAVGSDQPRGVIGDQFDGLPPYLFDGEKLQILRVKRSAITHAMKMYSFRKNAGQSRVLIAAFVPAEGDPLDSSSLTILPEGDPYDAYLTAPALDYLSDQTDLADLAAALGFERDHLGAVPAHLRRAGKAILHQQIEGGVRLVAVAVEDYGRLRLTDQTIRPVDPFAPPPTVKKKRRTPLPPPPPPLPALERTVVPGLGLPRLSIDNTSSRGLGLMFDDGQFYFVPGKTSREFVIDPGAYDVRTISQDPRHAGLRGRLHFSYHAKYSVTF